MGGQIHVIMEVAYLGQPVSHDHEMELAARRLVRVIPLKEEKPIMIRTAKKLALAATVATALIVVTCTSSSISAKTPASGLALTLPSPPTFSGRTDNHGGTETVTTSGMWKLVFVDAANDESQAEPNSGDSLSLSIPAGGAKVTSSLLSSCPVTNSAATVTAAYNDTNTATFTSQKIPGSACGNSATANFSGTYKTSTNASDSS